MGDKDIKQPCVLFSPIGGHDPISTYHDGPALHIFRTYKPKAVYLYLSKEMLEHHNRDDRYRECLRRCMEEDGFESEIKEPFERPDLENVQIFDTFYNDFEKCISIIKRENPGCNVILNASSGTPAMKGAIEVISTLSGEDILAVQVDTPERRENSPKDNVEYDNDLFWDLNEDRTDYKNRCREIHSANLLAKFKIESIKSLLDNYNYSGALELSKEIWNFPQKALKMLEAANYRSNFNIRECNKIIGNSSEINKKDFLPDITLNIQPIFEYLLILEIKVRNKNYADFIRALTPVILEVFDLYVNGKFHIDVKNEFYKLDESKDKKNKRKDKGKDNDKDKNGKYVIDNEKIDSLKGFDENREKIKDVIKNNINNRSDNFFSSFIMQKIIDALPSDPAVKTYAKDLRKIEKIIRNPAAHELMSLDEDGIIEKCGFGTKYILEALKTIITKSGYNIEPDYWSSYDKMNEVIKNTISPYYE